MKKKITNMFELNGDKYGKKRRRKERSKKKSKKSNLNRENKDK